MDDALFEAGGPPWQRERSGGGVPPWIDRAELDALFARRHPRVAGRGIPEVAGRLLRDDPPMRLLVPDPERMPRTRSGLRFCRAFRRTKPLADDVLACRSRRLHPAGDRKSRRG